MNGSAYAQGLAMGAGLIMAIGAQNAFVLTQGIRREHAGLIALLCIVCDALLIALGVLGLGQWFAHHALMLDLLAWAGAGFLGWYGAQAARRALANHGLHVQNGRAALSRGQAVATTLAVTLLNPHVYLDTVVLLGSLSAQFPGAGRYAFGLGAATSSVLWFLSLSYGAGRLAPVLDRPLAWKVLDSVVALVMFGLAGSLVAMVLTGQQLG